MNYSVLMAVYAKEKPQFLKASIDSMLFQTIPTNDFVIVKDGPLTPELDSVLDAYGDKLHLVPLYRPMGLGQALAIGLKHCQNELVARMDSDDLSRQERIERQLEAFRDHPRLVLCGGYIEEFILEPHDLGLKKKVPLSPKDIRHFARHRNPFNHVTVMFKKSAILQVGNYRSFYLNEDYELWSRILQKTHHVCNLPHCLCDVRVGNGMYERRGGWKYLKYDYALQRKLLERGLATPLDLPYNLGLRFAVRMMPATLRKHVYTRYLRHD